MSPDVNQWDLKEEADICLCNIWPRSWYNYSLVKWRVSETVSLLQGCLLLTYYQLLIRLSRQLSGVNWCYGQTHPQKTWQFSNSGNFAHFARLHLPQRAKKWYVGFYNHRTKKRHGCLSCLTKGLIVLQMLKVRLWLFPCRGHNT